jgi:hypothetical protein
MANETNAIPLAISLPVDDRLGLVRGGEEADDIILGKQCKRDC